VEAKPPDCIFEPGQRMGTSRQTDLEGSGPCVFGRPLAQESASKIPDELQGATQGIYFRSLCGYFSREPGLGARRQRSFA
jgi:hypothetical protein